MRVCGRQQVTSINIEMATLTQATVTDNAAQNGYADGDTVLSFDAFIRSIGVRRTEPFALFLGAARWIGITPSRLMSGGERDPVSAEISERCHIHLICRRPGVFLRSKKGRVRRKT